MLFADSPEMVLKEMIEKPEWILEMLMISLPFSLAWFLYDYLVKCPREDRRAVAELEEKKERAKLKRAQLLARKKRPQKGESPDGSRPN